MKKIFNNIFLVAYPFVVIIAMKYNTSISEQIMRSFIINPIQLIAFSLIYFALFAYFIFNFLIRKEDFNLVFLGIGLLEIILFSIPKFVFMISFNLASGIYSNIMLTYWSFGTVLVVYLLVLALKICKRKGM